MKKEVTPYKEFISKPEFSFWIPIVFTAVSITISFMSLSNQIALNNQKLDQVIANQVDIKDSYSKLQPRIGTLERLVSVLNVKEGLNDN